MFIFSFFEVSKRLVKRFFYLERAFSSVCGLSFQKRKEIKKSFYNIWLCNKPLKRKIFDTRRPMPMGAMPCRGGEWLNIRGEEREPVKDATMREHAAFFPEEAGAMAMGEVAGL